MALYLVTGGAGFIGSNLVEALLAKGERVRVLDDFSTGKRTNLAQWASRIELHEGSITRFEDCARATAGVDYVLHQAALPSVPKSVALPRESNEANITGTLNMLVAARDAKVKRFVVGLR
jgi:nucleoside-diphosphate-sugar epimerase